MSDLIYSYVFKLSRAKEHLETLDKELRAFLQPGSYEILDEYNIEGEVEGITRGNLTRRVVFEAEPPLLRLGVLVGDCIQNLRSCLDHIVFAISYSRNPDEFRDDRTTEFPIHDSPEAFNRVRRRETAPHHEIRGLPPAAQTIVERSQPYHRGEGNLSADPLWMLREMSNIDKHRSPHLTTWSAHTIAYDITGVFPGVSIHSLQVRTPGVIESGTVIAEVEFSTPNPAEPVMNMQKEFYFTISFGEGTPMVGQQIQDGLNALVAHVETIVDSLSGFIDP